MDEPAPQHPSGENQSRDNNFNFLRLVLASLVIVSHSYELIDGNRNREPLYRFFHHDTLAGIGVYGFFMLSGFLILQSWQRQPQWGAYLWKRMLRIYPAFIAAYLLSGLIVGPAAVADASNYFRQFEYWRFLRAMFFLEQPHVPEVFAGSPAALVNGAMWTIPYEFRSYLLVPMLASLGFAKHRWAWTLFAGTILFLSVFGGPFLVGPSSKFMEHVFPSGRDHALDLFAFFCFGSVFYLYHRNLRYRAKWAVICLALLIPCLYHQYLAHLSIATLGAYILFSVAFLNIPALNFFKTHSDISYGMYLYGWPVQKLLIWYVPNIVPVVVMLMTFLSVAVLAWLSWNYIELPFLRLKPRFKA